MFKINPRHIRRTAFATKIFPSIKSTLSLDTKKLQSSDKFDGELFCGGRSKNRDLLTHFGVIAGPDGSSTFLQLPLFRRSLKKLINLIEYELDLIGAQDVLMPTLIPQQLWIDSKRLERKSDALQYVYSFTDKNNEQMLLGPTFEESMTNLVGHSHNVFERDLPLLLYQTSPKFRFEPNPRFGLLRTNEFVMNDLYSFDADLDKAKDTYNRVSEIYDKIFHRLGLDCIKTESVTGSIGGEFSHEYQLVLASGEDKLIRCQDCNHYYNSEMLGRRTNGHTCIKCGSQRVDETKALELGHTFLLSDTYSKPLRAKYTAAHGGRVHLQMGCFGLGLTRIIGAGVDLLSIAPTKDKPDDPVQVRWPRDIEPFKCGLVTPAKRSKQYNAGSTGFAQNFLSKVMDSTSKIDFIIEDRDKDGIYKRLVCLQNLGVPYIIVIGQRFLQETPEFELLKLNRATTTYDQEWLTEAQLCNRLLQLDKEA